jgi:hypothetical protein
VDEDAQPLGQRVFNERVDLIENRVGLVEDDAVPALWPIVSQVTHAGGLVQVWRLPPSAVDDAKDLVRCQKVNVLCSLNVPEEQAVLELRSHAVQLPKADGRGQAIGERLRLSSPVAQHEGACSVVALLNSARAGPLPLKNARAT